MSRYTRDFGKSSSWYTKGWAPFKNTHSGWSKNVTRGYYSHEWDEDASRGSTQTRGYNLRRGPIRRSRSWMSKTESRAGPLRAMPRAERQQTPPGTLQEMLLQRKDHDAAIGENSIDCSTVVKGASPCPQKQTNQRFGVAKGVLLTITGPIQRVAAGHQIKQLMKYSKPLIKT